MPRAVRTEGEPTQLRNAVATMINDADLEMVRRVMERYGLSKSGAARLLLRAGAAHHDPSPPKENTK